MAVSLDRSSLIFVVSFRLATGGGGIAFRPSSSMLAISVNLQKRLFLETFGWLVSRGAGLGWRGLSVDFASRDSVAEPTGCYRKLYRVRS